MVEVGRVSILAINIIILFLHKNWFCLEIVGTDANFIWCYCGAGAYFSRL